MFGPMKEALRGRRFSSDEKVICAVQNWLKTAKKPFSDGIKKRVKHWNRRVEVKRDYVEMLILVSFLYIYYECVF
jgi:hypothetical protein